jgi:hypothetical protein
MEKHALKHLIYGGIEEIIGDRHYYYHSPVGESYSHFTEDGEKVIVEFMNTMAYKICHAEEAELDCRAKEMVLKELKS